MSTRTPFFYFAAIGVDRFKMLYWDKDGFLLCYKQIENGQLQCLEKKEEVRQLSAQQIHWLLDDLSIHQLKAIKAGTRGLFYAEKNSIN